MYPPGSDSHKLWLLAKDTGHPDHKQAATELRHRRETSKQLHQEALIGLRDNEKIALKACRKESGLWWHHYQATNDLRQQAEQLARSGNSKLQKKDPNKAMPHLTLYFPRGLAVHDFVKGLSPILFFDPAHSSGKHRVIKYATQSLGKQQYKTVSVPLVWHRELPETGVIRRVELLENQCLRKQSWSVLFTIENAPEPRKLAPEAPVYCGLDFGWRVQDDSLRVAYWSASNGDVGEIFLPPQWIASAKYLEKLRQQIRQDAQICWESLNASGVQGIGSGMHPTKLLINLYQNRDTLTDQARPLLDEWWRGSARFLREAEGLSDRLAHQRTHLYQNECKSIVSRFDIIGTEEIGLQGLQVLQSKAPYTVRRGQRWAAINELTHWLTFNCKKQGKPFRLVSNNNNTQRCAKCGHLNQQSTIKKLIICEKCQSLWDQDANASENILSRMTSGEGV